MTEKTRGSPQSPGSRKSGSITFISLHGFSHDARLYLPVLPIYTVYSILASYIANLREHQQKTFVMLSRFWPLIRGSGCLSESVKKGKFVMKIFFSDNVV